MTLSQTSSYPLSTDCQPQVKFPSLRQGSLEPASLTLSPTVFWALFWFPPAENTSSPGTVKDPHQTFRKGYRTLLNLVRFEEGH